MARMTVPPSQILGLVHGVDFEVAPDGLCCLHCAAQVIDRPERHVTPSDAGRPHQFVPRQDAMFVLEEHLTLRHPQTLPSLRGHEIGLDYLSTAEANGYEWRQQCLICGAERLVWNGSWIAAHYQTEHLDHPPAAREAAGLEGETVPRPLCTSGRWPGATCCGNYPPDQCPDAEWLAARERGEPYEIWIRCGSEDPRHPGGYSGGCGRSFCLVGKHETFPTMPDHECIPGGPGNRTE
jgi:hypothetical protein